MRTHATMNEFFSTCVTASFSSVCVHMPTGACRCRFMPLCRCVDTIVWINASVLLCSCVYTNATYTLLSIEKTDNASVNDLSIASGTKPN